MTMVKYGSEAWMLWETEENLLDVSQRNYQRIILSTQLTDHIPNSNLCKNVVRSHFSGL